MEPVAQILIQAIYFNNRSISYGFPCLPHFEKGG